MKLALAVFAAALAIPALAADQTQVFPTQTLTVRITPIYHATARITAGRDVMYIDPAKPAKIDGMGPGDLILITDIHGDHMDADDVAKLSKSGTTVIAPAAVARPSRTRACWPTASPPGGMTGRSPRCPCTTSTTTSLRVRPITTRAAAMVMS
jgi:hypothetical protein